MIYMCTGGCCCSCCCCMADDNKNKLFVMEPINGFRFALLAAESSCRFSSVCLFSLFINDFVLLILIWTFFLSLFSTHLHNFSFLFFFNIFLLFFTNQFLKTFLLSLMSLSLYRLIVLSATTAYARADLVVKPAYLSLSQLNEQEIIRKANEMDCLDRSSILWKTIK